MKYTQELFLIDPDLRFRGWSIKRWKAINTNPSDEWEGYNDFVDLSYNKHVLAQLDGAIFLDTTMPEGKINNLNFKFNLYNPSYLHQRALLFYKKQHFQV